MTNKEKYIDNASNEDLAQIISKLRYSCQYCPAYKECRKDGSLSYEEWIGECEERFLKWLSQEADEDTVHIPNIGKMPKTDKKVELTEQAYKDILARLDKLENRIKNSVGIVIKEDDNYDPYEQIDYNPKHEEIDLDTMQPVKTADEMFEELGYKRCSTINWKWVKLSDTDCLYLTYILIYNNKFAKWDEKGNGTQYHRLITEAEDKAIHKKIEELKK